MKTSTFVGSLLATLLITGVASAEKQNFHLALSHDQENTAPDIGAKDPRGEADVTYDTVTKQICGKVTYTDLTGAATGIHLHQAPPGDPTGDGVAPAQGKLIIPVGPSPVSFNFTLSAAFATSLDNDELYLNVHTAANTTGEARSGAPWEAGTVTVPCGTATNPDGGAPITTSSSGADASTTSSSGSTSGSTTSSTSSTGGTSSSTTSSASSSGDSDAGSGAKPAEEAKSGCNSAGSPVNALSFAFIVGVGIAAVSSRARRNKKK